jgi:hypothetical protein
VEGFQPLSFDWVVGSQFHHGHVSNSRHVKRSERISRTPLSCLFRPKGYAAYRARSAFGITLGKPGNP